MKKISINSQCNQCGICVVKCPEVFSENDEGNIYVLSETVDETDVIRAIVNLCPVKAIELGTEVNLRESISSYLNTLETLKNGINVTIEDISFHDRFCSNVYVPRAGMSGYSYRSSSAAERAGYDAFCSRSYSQIDNLILERITNYRVSIIKPYYSTDNDSVYTKNNKKIEKILKAVVSIIGSEKVSNDFCNVNVYPDTRDTTWRMLEKGELISDDYICSVKSEFDYKAADYKTYIDWYDMEDWRGKNTYSYSANEASEELGKDLGNAFRWAKREIEERALEPVKWLVDMYNKKLKICLDEKISVIKNL